MPPPAQTEPEGSIIEAGQSAEGLAEVAESAEEATPIEFGAPTTVTSVQNEYSVQVAPDSGVDAQAVPVQDWVSAPTVDAQNPTTLFSEVGVAETGEFVTSFSEQSGIGVPVVPVDLEVTVPEAHAADQYAQVPRQINYQAEPALVIRNLHKSFGAKHAVNDLSLTVPAGCLFGIVGPNGAGKTTTLSMVTGLLRPDHGSVWVWGHDVWSDPAKAKATMGVLPDGLRLFDRLSGRELLAFCGDMRSMNPAVAKERAEELLAALGLTNDADTLVADYSAGMTKKIALAAALIHRPRLLILDEPFEAVDPVSGQAIRSILNDFVNGGGTVVLSSHVMELVESLCDAVAVISDGQVLMAGEIAEVKQGVPLQQRFLQLVGAEDSEGGRLKWLRRSSDSN